MACPPPPWRSSIEAACEVRYSSRFALLICEFSRTDLSCFTLRWISQPRVRWAQHFSQPCPPTPLLYVFNFYQYQVTSSNLLFVSLGNVLVSALVLNVLCHSFPVRVQGACRHYSKFLGSLSYIGLTLDLDLLWISFFGSCFLELSWLYA